MIPPAGAMSMVLVSVGCILVGAVLDWLIRG